MHYAKTGWRRLRLTVLVLISLFIASVFLCRYNLYVFEKAVTEVPEKYKTFLVKCFTFKEDNALKEWEEKIFKGKVIYRVEKDKAFSYVRATSHSAASALYYKITLYAKKRYPVIGWKWGVTKFPEKKFKESLETENEDDFAARVYVIFPARFLLNSKVLEYIWTETLPAGTIGTSPYSKNIKLIVLRSGLAGGGWYYEQRDIRSDYFRAFGRSPEHDIGAVAFMTNAEHTGTSADAMYTDIRLGYRGDGLFRKEGRSDENKVLEDKAHDK